MTSGSKKVYCIGETVLDIIFRNDKPIGATPGGSMLNSSVSLGRAGIPVYFISDYANDHAGNIVHDFLIRNGISTDYISRYPNGKTAIALAFLDHRQNADYSFYKIFPEDRFLAPLPVPQAGDIILFGSFYALTKTIRNKVMGFVRSGKSNGAFILYDPNFRSAHLEELETLRPWILENIGMANLVRGSDEDFRTIFNAADARQAYHFVSGAGCSSLVYTRSSSEIEVIHDGYSKSYLVPPISVLSTIGAGDAFNAGVIYGMLQTYTLTGLTTLTGSVWDHLIGCGIQFSANVCQGLDNYISVDLGNRLRESITTK